MSAFRKELFRTSSEKKNSDELNSNNIKEDRRLAQWYKYLNERHNICARLVESVKRPECHLLINSVESARPINEDKLIIDYTSIFDPPDKYRGSPSFWTIPVRLLPKCPGQQILEAQKNAHQKCKVPTIEYVTIPDKVKEEIGAVARAEAMVNRWYLTPYRQTKLVDLADRIKFIQPHKPNLDEIVVTGVKIQNKNDISENEQTSLEKSLIPKINVVPPMDNISKTTNNESLMEIGTIQYKIVDQVIKDIKRRSSELHVYLTFVCSIEQECSIVKTCIPITNQGTATLQCHWQQNYLRNINLPLAKLTDDFIFDKSLFTLLPGQTRQLEFMINPQKVGISREEWQLLITPNVKNLAIIFNCWATVEQKTTKELLTSIKTFLEETANQEEVIEDKQLQCLDTEIPYGWFVEEERFSIANINMNTKQPKYVYQKYIVSRLKEFYDEIKGNSTKEWDLSVQTLSDTINERSSDFKQRSSLFKELNDILYPIKTVPSEQINPEFRKRQLVHNILSTTIAIIFDDAIKLASELNIKLPTFIYPKYELKKPFQETNLYKDPAQILFVSNEFEQIKCFKRFDYVQGIYNITKRPPRKFESRLTNICDKNIMERFAIIQEYKQLHQAPVVPQTPKKEKGKKEAKTDKKGKADTKPVPAKAGGLPATSVPERREKPTAISVDQANYTFYKEVVYIRTYTNLLKAIDDITAIIESCNIDGRQPTLHTLDHLVKCQLAAGSFVEEPAIPCVSDPCQCSEELNK